MALAVVRGGMSNGAVLIRGVATRGARRGGPYNGFRHMCDEAVQRRLAKSAGRTPGSQVAKVEAVAETASSPIRDVFLHTPTAIERAVLVIGLEYPMFKVPAQVTYGRMNTAWSRTRLWANGIVFIVMMVIAEVAIREGKAAVDDPNVPSLYRVRSGDNSDNVRAHSESTRSHGGVGSAPAPS